jgi:hypothetical protein
VSPLLTCCKRRAAGGSKRVPTMTRILIIGGSDAGISAALRARELDPTVEITIALADDYPNFSICGLPYFLSGETPDWRQLAHRTEFPGIRILRGHRAVSIDVVAKAVAFEVAGASLIERLFYDRLVIATGAAPILPDPGRDRVGDLEARGYRCGCAFSRSVRRRDQRHRHQLHPTLVESLGPHPGRSAELATGSQCFHSVCSRASSLPIRPPEHCRTQFPYR